MKRLIISLLAIVVVIGLVVVSCRPKPPERPEFPEEMPFGMIVDLSGPHAEMGKRLSAGAEIAVEHMNDWGGIRNMYSMHLKLIVADEPITMIDVSMRIGILDLMLSLRERLGTAYLFITHDFGAARYFSAKGGGRIAVMYLGKIIEIGAAEDVIRNPLHPYTKALLEAVPVPDPEISKKKRMPKLRSLDIPSPLNPPSGCKFHTRCPYAFDRCSRKEPPMVEVEKGHWVACWLYAKR